MSVWPPPYYLRKHRLTKNVKLIASRKGLIVSVPLRFSVKKIPQLLEAHKQWIMKHLAQLPQTVNPSLPDEISLVAAGQTWRILYQANLSKLSWLERPGCELLLASTKAEGEKSRVLLKRWLRHYAACFLTSTLDELSQVTGLAYNKVSIRDQHTRWGSCNAEKAINLNFKLIFLTPSLCRHIILHELCHTRHLNHSGKFWQLLKQFDPHYLQHKHQLRYNAHAIPAWL